MFINPKRRELNLKIVYYGPARGGKTTNLQYIHNRADPKLCGDLVSLKTHEDRTLFFDYMQMELGKIKGLTPKFNLYTVPGQVYYAASRKLILKGADGIIFVADSQQGRLQANLRAYRDMFQHLKELRMSPKKIPIVVQFNKRDLPNIMPVQTLRAAMRLNGQSPCFESIAIEGPGVYETLKMTIGLVIKQAKIAT
jgi:hypothetical protein